MLYFASFFLFFPGAVTLSSESKAPYSVVILMSYVTIATTRNRDIHAFAVVDVVGISEIYIRKGWYTVQQ
jgi:hypothetical protein